MTVTIDEAINNVENDAYHVSAETALCLVAEVRRLRKVETEYADYACAQSVLSRRSRTIDGIIELRQRAETAEANYQKAMEEWNAYIKEQNVVLKDIQETVVLCPACGEEYTFDQVMR